MPTRLAIRSTTDGSFVEVQDLMDDASSKIPGIAIWEKDDRDDLLNAASIYVETNEFEIVEVEIEIKVISVIETLGAAMAGAESEMEEEHDDE